MTKNDTDPFQFSDIGRALALLSRLPVPSDPGTRTAEAAWAYPLAGLAVGALAALSGWLAHLLGLPDAGVALLCVAVPILLTGAMHEDGLADTADGLWGGWTRERRLEIMKDSHIGSYGVLALILSVLARWCALSLLLDAGTGQALAALVAAAALSRAAMPGLMAALPPARPDGLSHSVGAVSPGAAGVAFALAALVAVLLTGLAAFWAILWAVAATCAVAAIARRKIGGQTGDILGACQQCAEIAVLFSLLA